MNTWKNVIVLRYPDAPCIHLYYAADWHVGSPECNIRSIKESIMAVLNDPLGIIVFAGDLISNGLKNSKTNVYEEILTPSKQVDTVVELLKPLADADKIACLIPGNHESRSAKEADHNPMREIALRLGVLDRYRDPMAGLCIYVGARRKDKSKSTCYTVAVAHGASKAKTERWAENLEGFDIVIVGHTHTSLTAPKAKLRMNTATKMLSVTPYIYIVCCSEQEYGGYAVRGAFPATATGVSGVLELTGSHKSIKTISYSSLTN